MRIVYLNPCAQMGGAETSLVELLASIRTLEPAWELWLVLGEDGPLADKVRPLGVRVILMPFPSALARLGDRKSRLVATLLTLFKGFGPTITYVRRLSDTVNAVQPQIIHTNGFKMHLLGAWARPRGVPLLWHIHDYVRSRKLMRLALRWSASQCTAVIANSKDVANDVKALLTGLTVETIYNAIDLTKFAQWGQKHDLDAAAGLPAPPEGTIRVGLVATFAHWKGHRVFLEALSLLPGDLPIRGYIVGGPIYQTLGSQHTMKELRQEAERLGLTGKVGFTGFLDDSASAMRSLDIIVHASIAPEPFGMVIIEGMACGKAVIASAGGGATELFTDGKNALAHTPGDSEMLARQIQRLVSDEGLRKSLGQAGAITTQRLYNRQRLGGALTTLYSRVSGLGHIQRGSKPTQAVPLAHT